jgi:hypothetical protein
MLRACPMVRMIKIPAIMADGSVHFPPAPIISRCISKIITMPLPRMADVAISLSSRR